jgi:hypothetical protein
MSFESGRTPQADFVEERVIHDSKLTTHDYQGSPPAGDIKGEAPSLGAP